MRYFALLLSLATAASIPIVAFPANIPASVSVEQIFAAIALIPLSLICAFLLIYSAIGIRNSEHTGFYLLIFVVSLALPGTLIGKYVTLRVGNSLYWQHKNAWLAEGDYINPILLRYYREYPERFHKKQFTERVDVDGFIDYLKSDPNFRNSKLQIKEQAIFDPWGRPIEFLLDQNSDNQLYGRNESIWIGTSEPVKAAVGLLLSESSERALRGYEYIYGANGYELLHK